MHWKRNVCLFILLECIIFFFIDFGGGFFSGNQMKGESMGHISRYSEKENKLLVESFSLASFSVVSGDKACLIEKIKKHLWKYIICIIFIYRKDTWLSWEKAFGKAFLMDYWYLVSTWRWNPLEEKRFHDSLDFSFLTLSASKKKIFFHWKI